MSSAGELIADKKLGINMYTISGQTVYINNISNPNPIMDFKNLFLYSLLENPVKNCGIPPIPLPTSKTVLSRDTNNGIINTKKRYPAIPLLLHSGRSIPSLYKDRLVISKMGIINATI